MLSIVYANIKPRCILREKKHEKNKNRYLVCNLKGKMPSYCKSCLSIHSLFIAVGTYIVMGVIQVGTCIVCLHFVRFKKH